MVEKFATKQDTSLVKIPTFFFWEFFLVGIPFVCRLGLFRAKLVVVKIVMLGTCNK